MGRRSPIWGACEAMPTLRQALEIAARERWDHTRNTKTQRCQAGMAIAGLEALGVTTIEGVLPEHIKTLRDQWRLAGLAYNTIAKRLMCLSSMGVSITGLMPKKVRKAKWWLNPQTHEEVTKYLRRPNGDPGEPDFADFVDWQCFTGLRVEESMRLTWGHIFIAFDPSTQCPQVTGMGMTVPGLKTSASQATLPVGPEAAALLLKRWHALGHKGSKRPESKLKVFPISYARLRLHWARVRDMCLGSVKGQESMCTLKSLRRSAARYLHVDRGMPLDVTRQYLRHENVKTTMEYLNLTGGYGTEEMRRWL